MPCAVLHVFTYVDVLSKIGRQFCDESGHFGVNRQRTLYLLDAAVGPIIVLPGFPALRRYDAVTTK